MEKHGLIVKLKARKGKEAELQSFLKAAQALASQEEGTQRWYAYRVESGSFGIFDTFATQEGRQAHLEGEIAARLMAQAPELVEGAPSIERIDILAQK